MAVQVQNGARFPQKHHGSPPFTRGTISSEMILLVGSTVTHAQHKAHLLPLFSGVRCEMSRFSSASTSPITMILLSHLAGSMHSTLWENVIMGIHSVCSPFEPKWLAYLSPHASSSTAAPPIPHQYQLSPHSQGLGKSYCLSLVLASAC